MRALCIMRLVYSGCHSTRDMTIFNGAHCWIDIMLNIDCIRGFRRKHDQVLRAPLEFEYFTKSSNTALLACFTVHGAGHAAIYPGPWYAKYILSV